MDISLGKQGANWHSQEVAQVLHGLLESVVGHLWYPPASQEKVGWARQGLLKLGS